PGGLVEPCSVDPGAGTKVAVSDSGDEAAANDVWQVAVYEPPLSATGSLIQPGMGPSFSKNETTPWGAGELGVTVAVKVTVWLVTGAFVLGESVVVVGVRPEPGVSTVAVTAWALSLIFSVGDVPAKHAIW